MGYQPPPVRSERHICFSLMDCALIHSETSESILHPDRNLFVFGCAVVAECSKRMYSADLDSVASAFRVLGDKSRLDLLMRLAQGRSYCQQLADEAHCNSGNMSEVSPLYPNTAFYPRAGAFTHVLSDRFGGHLQVLPGI